MLNNKQTLSNVVITPHFQILPMSKLDQYGSHEVPPLQYPKSSRILSFQAKAFPKKNVHCNIVKHTTKPHLIGAIENINTIDDYRPKIVRIIVFFYYHHSSNRRHFAIKTLFLASFDPRSSMVKSVFDCSLSGVETNFFFNKNMTEKCR